MRSWVVFSLLFGLFFGMAELYPWVAEAVGSMPGVLVAGVVLAIASNLDKLPRKAAQLSPSPQSTPPAPPPAPPPISPPAPPRTILPPPAPPTRSISFTIKKPTHPPSQSRS